MTDRSYFWSCANVGDGGLDSFSQEKVMTILGMFGFSYDPELSGIIPWRNTNTTILGTLGLGAVAANGELKPEYLTSPNRIRINTGLGISGGIIYISNVNTDFTLSANISGYANAVDRIVLRRDMVNQRVRPVYIRSTGAGLTASLVNTNTYWDVPIARIVLDGSGNYSSMIDDRKYATSPSAGRILLAEDYVIAGGIDKTYAVGSLYTRIELEVVLDKNTGTTTINMQFNGDTGSNYEGATAITTTISSGGRQFIHFTLPLPGLSPLSAYYQPTYRKSIAVSGLGGIVVDDDIVIWNPAVAAEISSIRVFSGGDDSDDDILIRVWGYK